MFLRKFIDSVQKASKYPSRSEDCVHGGVSYVPSFFVLEPTTVVTMVSYDTLLQNATDIITKCESYFTTKYDKSLYYKMRQAFITKCGSYYKMLRLLQNVSVHTRRKSLTVCRLKLSFTLNKSFMFFLCFLSAL